MYFMRTHAVHLYYYCVWQVKPESATDFEEVWKKRESHLKDMPGFVRFAMLRCEAGEGQGERQGGGRGGQGKERGWGRGRARPGSGKGSGAVCRCGARGRNSHACKCSAG